MSLILSGTDGLSDVDGSAATPAIRGTDANTGIFFPAADTIAFAEGGAEVARFDSSGNFGLGVTPSTTVFAGSKMLQVGFTPNVIQGITSANFSIAQGAFFNSSTVWQSLGTGQANTLYSQVGGSHQWFNAPITSLGSTVSFTQAMTLDASGRLGIGTSSPTTPLQIQSTAATGVNSIFCTGSTTAFNFWTISNTSGNARIGVDSSSGGALATGSAAYSTVIGSSTATSLHLISNGAVGATINSSGNVRINYTGNIDASNPERFGITHTYPQTGMAMANGSTTQTYAILFTNPNGIVGSIQTGGTATSYLTASDYRLKENIVPMIGALDKVAQLNPVNYKWKIDGSNGQGFIAHELQSVIPECVSGKKDETQIEKYEISPAVSATYDKNGEELTPAIEAVMGEREVPRYQGVDTSFLVATLTAAIQEQQALIQTLTDRITALESA